MLAYIGPGPGLAVQAPALLLLTGILVGLLSLLTLPLRWLWRRPKKRGPARARRVVLLGLDGLEPSLLEEGMRAGRLPHFQALAAEGGYQRLATTCPPLSPVAWSTFATGLNPGKHGVFDFVHRTPELGLKLAFSEVSGGRPRQLRKGRSFWEILGEYGVFSQILRVPVSWPSGRFFGTLLSAMGIPDLRGTQGVYTLFSPQPRELREGVNVLWRDGRADFELPSGSVRLHLRRLQGQWRLSWAGQQLDLQVGRYSPWCRLQFGRSPGLVKFLLLDDSPQLYATPVQLDPERPVLGLSYPNFFSASLALLLGPYATCGLAEDTGAREDGVLSPQQFLEQAYAIHEERRGQFLHLLERTPVGLCAAVFDGPDRIQHMALDCPETITDLYGRMDELVGETRARLRPGEVLLVLSDHGFKPFRRSVDVNAWLRAEGYLRVDDRGRPVWPETRAIALGLAGLHLNLRGRQARGCVPPEQADDLKAELRRRLLEMVDPLDGTRPLLEVFDNRQCYQGPYSVDAPDLVLGWEVGYRIAKSAGRGEVGEQIFADNTSAWCGDHCLHPQRVPGVLLCNQPLRPEASLLDLAPTVLDFFGVPRPAALEGRSLCVD
ncbi:MAG: alkaline phosphatase family protein [Candidatus Eremiobacteraeota bacterium]|nr:alkaline phosphatase family protein [Candidatus Eremiobacteraeota bacterium]MCW5868315.1 alkaline phosphatase family protein [Candidatus Eremiobacteraeota bacterium]